MVSPDGQYIVATGYGPGVMNRAFVGKLDSLADMQQISPDGEAWNCMSWSADSRSIVVTRLVAPGTWKQGTYDVATGTIVDIFDTEFPSRAMPCGRLLDDDTLLVTEDDPESGLMVISSQDVGSDTREAFVSIPDCITIYPQVRLRTGEVAVITGCANVYDSGLWIVPAGGGAPRHVLNGLVAAPTWSPNGAWILFGFQANRTSVPSLWIASPDGSTASQVADGWASWPAWIPADTSCGLCPT
jgi:Tol biopolymer transport system component